VTDPSSAELDAERAVAGLPPLVPLRLAAALFHVDERTVRRWAREGALRIRRTSSRGSGRVLIERCELARFLLAMPLQPARCDGHEQHAATFPERSR